VSHSSGWALSASGFSHRGLRDTSALQPGRPNLRTPDPVLGAAPTTRRRVVATVLDVVGVHMVGGILGALLTGAFASLAVNPAGANGSLIKVGRQAGAVAMTLAFSFGITMLILRIVDSVVGLRATEEAEETGLDLAEHGEGGYALTERVVVSAPSGQPSVTGPDAKVLVGPEEGL
jgi:hypothetical protein